jgi:hypothetical protein
MTLRFLGKKSLALAVPMLATLVAAFDLAGLAGEIAALTAITVTFVPPSIVGVISLIAGLQAAIDAGLQPPSVTIQADLIVKLGLLKAKFDLLVSITNLLLAAGVHAYVYEGAASGMGTALGAEFTPGPSQGGITSAGSVYSVVLVVESSNSATVTAVRTVFGDLT